MLVKIYLESERFSDKEKQQCDSTPFFINWDCHALPQKGNIVWESVVGTENMFDFCWNLIWHVETISWDRMDGKGKVFPVITLIGE